MVVCVLFFNLSIYSPGFEWSWTLVEVRGDVDGSMLGGGRAGQRVSEAEAGLAPCWAGLLQVEEARLASTSRNTRDSTQRYTVINTSKQPQSHTSTHTHTHTHTTARMHAHVCTE